MATFTNISKRKINISFVEPKTGEEILKEMKSNQEKYGYGKNEYKIVDNVEENNLIKANDEKRKENAIKEVKEVSKNKDFKNAKERKDFSSEIEKKLETFMEKKDGMFEITSRIPNKVLIKNLLPLADGMKEKKDIVSEAMNLKLDEAKKKLEIIEVTLNNKIYKIKFSGEQNG